MGWRIILPMCIAIMPLGLALGVLVVQAGFEWWWGPVFAAVIFAGSMEFLIIGLFAAAAPLGQIALSTLLVNFRHVFYAFTFPLHQVKGRWAKAYSTFALTDEAFAVTTTPGAQNWSGTRILSIQAFFQLVWVLSVVVGALFGTLIPSWIVGLDFAVTALFVVLTMEAYKQRKSLPAPVLALVCTIVAMLISSEHMLLIAMGLFVGGLTVSYFFGKWRQRRHV